MGVGPLELQAKYAPAWFWCDASDLPKPRKLRRESRRYEAKQARRRRRRELRLTR